MVDKLGVFIDYENVHRTGHGLFERFGSPLYESVVDPVLIAERLASKRPRACELMGIWIYRGRPAPTVQPVPSSANDLQAQSWETDPRVRLTRRDLKYEWHDDDTFTAREKGIDVALAVGLTESALDRAFDAAIVFSGDTDLLPALDLVFKRRLVNLEIAAWSGQKPLWFPDLLNSTPPRRLPYCHFLSDQDFRECRDFSGVRD
ncbi:MAG: NYN domain-containing protein [Microbacteriaceae bacterium]|nr:NYN domain-containing protein [Microbacteriaceae bacterium]